MSTDTAVRKAITVAVPQDKAFSAFTRISGPRWR